MSATRNLSTRLQALARRLRRGKKGSGHVRGAGGVHSRRPLFESLEDRRLLAGDIKLWIPQDLGPATPGSTVVVPVKAEVTDAAGVTISGFDVALHFDSTKLSVVDSQLGALVAPPASDIQEGGHTVPEPGWLVYEASGTNGSAPLSFGTIGNLFTVTFMIAADAPPGDSVFNLLSSYIPPAPDLPQPTAVFDNTTADLEIDSAPTNADTDTVDGLLTIVSSVTVAVSPSSVAEDGTVDLDYTFTRTGGTANPLTVTFTTGGAADDASDYVVGGAGVTYVASTNTGTVTIPAGSSSAVVKVDPTADTAVEADEDVVLTVVADSGYVAGASGSASGTIANDDTGLAIEATDAIKTEGNTGSKPFTFTVTRTGLVTGATDVTWTVAGSGTNPADAADFAGGTLPTDTLSFAAYETSKTITVNVNGDTTVEPNETFTVTLSTPTGGATLLTSAADGTIQNDDTGGPTQIVRGKQASRSGPAGQPLTFAVEYTTSDNDQTLTGLGLRMHYDSTFMTYTSLVNVLASGFVAQEGPLDDTSNFDGDAATDKYIRVAWASVPGNWPDQTLPLDLFSSNYTLAAGLSVGSSSLVRFTAESTASGYTLDAEPITITVGPPVNLDVDNNGSTDALTDGILILRYLFNFTGTALTQGAVAPNAARTDSSQIIAFLDGGRTTMLDVDGNGAADALTDGILVLRYLFSFTGTALTTGALAPNATRTSSTDIIAYLEGFDPDVPAGDAPLGEGGSNGALADFDGLVGAFGANGDVQAETGISSGDVDLLGEGDKQIVTAVPTTSVVEPGTTVGVDVMYDTLPQNNQLTGVGFFFHYNSSLLTTSLAQITSILPNDFVQVEIQDDTNNADGDASTDKRINISWADASPPPTWPNVALPTRLLHVTFDVAAGFTSGSTTLKFSPTSVASGWEFQSTPATVTSAPETLGSIGDFVWDDANSNGIQDSGEAGIDGVTVELLNATGTTVLATQTTSGGGHYLFQNLSAGDYVVAFTAPDGKVFTAKDQGGNDALDSDADVSTGRTGVITVAVNQDVTTVDAGLRLPVPATEMWINEILFNPPGFDRPNEYIELRGTPGGNSDGNLLVGIEGDRTTQTLGKCRTSSICLAWSSEATDSSSAAEEQYLHLGVWRVRIC
jgi:hypothetical protein